MWQQDPHTKRRNLPSTVLCRDTSQNRLKSLVFPMGVLLALPPALLQAHPPPVSETVEVTETRADSLVGQAETSSEGTVGAPQLELRPVLRPGELVEAVPGVVVTQHSGDGKANQYFVRGFNLDHGTDLALSVEGMPVNLPTHAHGQGYADLNFVIPELVEGIQYQKGPHHASVGDFGAAGAIQLGLYRSLPASVVALGVGDFGYRRLLVAASPKLGRSASLLAALEAQDAAGPWEVPEDFQKLNGLLRYASGTEDSGFSILGMLYSAQWNSTDQIPERAVASGQLDLFGSMDATDGGRAQRASLSGEVHRRQDAVWQRLHFWIHAWKLNLWSNFTYFLEDPINGDQFEQSEQRLGGGLSASQRWVGLVNQWPLDLHLGLQTRTEWIPGVGLYRTQARERLSTTREDEVLQGSLGLWSEATLRPVPWARGTLGLRGDVHAVQVQAQQDENSGQRMAALPSPRLGIALGPFSGAEVYLNLGQGFHSNDARGATMTRDPASGEAVEPVTLLVPAWGAEVGGRYGVASIVQSSLTFWALSIASELLFVGDAGTTEASRPSLRQGVEWTNFLTPLPGLQLDADLALSNARFVDGDPAGPYIPGAVERVISVGASYRLGRAVQLGSRVRHFGPRPLTEDNSVRSDPATLVHASLAFAPAAEWKIELECFNLLDAQVADQQYYYESRLPDEPLEGVGDIHVHPSEPRSLRLTFQGRF